MRWGLFVIRLAVFQVCSRESDRILLQGTTGCGCRHGSAGPGGLIDGCELKIPALAEECEWIFVGDLPDQVFGVFSPAHFENEIGNRGGFGRSPVAGRIRHQSFGAELFDHIDGASRGAFAHGVERHAGPETGIEYGLDGMFFDVIDQDASSINA